MKFLLWGQRFSQGKMHIPRVPPNRRLWAEVYLITAVRKDFDLSPLSLSISDIGFANLSLCKQPTGSLRKYRGMRALK